MAYDFHLEKDTVKLIEVNTNASAFLLANLLYQSSKEEFESSLKSFKKLIFYRNGKNLNPHKNTAKNRSNR